MGCIPTTFWWNILVAMTKWHLFVWMFMCSSGWRKSCGMSKHFHTCGMSCGKPFLKHLYTCGGVFVRMVCLDEDQRDLPRMVCKEDGSTLWQFVNNILQVFNWHFGPIQEVWGADFHLPCLCFHPPFLCLLCVSSVQKNLQNAKRTFAERTWKTIMRWSFLVSVIFYKVLQIWQQLSRGGTAFEIDKRETLRLFLLQTAGGALPKEFIQTWPDRSRWFGGWNSTKSQAIGNSKNIGTPSTLRIFWVWKQFLVSKHLKKVFRYLQMLNCLC